MPDQPKILLAEDHQNLGFLTKELLEFQGYGVAWCKDGHQAWELFLTQSFDVCLIDVMMPVMDGFELAEKIRSRDAHIPILFLTARSLIEDKRRGFQVGADDYLIKPFEEEELLLRVKALLKRNPLPKTQQDGIVLGAFRFFPALLKVTLGDQHWKLTEKENRVLAHLAQHANHLVKRETILETIWGENDYFLGRSLDVFISRLRKILKADPRIQIENVFGVGFILHLPALPAEYT